MELTSDDSRTQGDQMQPDRLSDRLTARASDWLSEHAPTRRDPAAAFETVETSESPAPEEGIDELEDTGPMLMMVGGSADPRDTSGRHGRPVDRRHGDAARRFQGTPAHDVDRSPVSHLPLHGPTGMLLEGPEITCRTVNRYDHNLLRAIFVECRSIGLTTLPVTLAGALLDMQYRAHRIDRQANWPRAVSEILQVRGVPAGLLNICVDRNEIRIVDLDIMMGFRRKGVGGFVLQTIQQNSARLGLPLRVTVSAANRTALGICLRRGFETVRRTDTDLELEWRT